MMGCVRKLSHGLVAGMEHFPGLPVLALQTERHFSSGAEISENKTHADLAYKKYLHEHCNESFQLLKRSISQACPEGLS